MLLLCISFFFTRVSGPPSGPPISGATQWANRPREEEQSPYRGPKPPNSSKRLPPPESNSGGKLGGRVGVPLGQCPLGSMSFSLVFLMSLLKFIWRHCMSIKIILQYNVGLIQCSPNFISPSPVQTCYYSFWASVCFHPLNWSSVQFNQVWFWASQQLWCCLLYTSDAADE